MAQVAEKILGALAPHMRTVGRALQGSGASLMAYEPPAAAAVGVHLEANGARPAVSEGAFVAPTATLIGAVSVSDGAAVNYGAVVEAGAATLAIEGFVGDGAVVQGPVGAGALVGPNAVVFGAVERHAVVGAGAVVSEGAAVFGSLGPGSLLAPGAQVPAAELWSGAPAQWVRALTASDLERASAERALAAAAAAVHRDECAKDYSTLLAEEAEWEDLQARHPKYFKRVDADALDEMTSVGGMDTGVVPGRILNSKIQAADGAAPHGDATRH
jgi:carbonic anhydrase/acetyltransferase-like protein (isoleucine patch superfamily)